MTKVLPQAVYIEPTNLCNLKCLMCPHGHGLINEKGMLDYSLFSKIMNDIEAIPNFNPLIGLHMNGEPLLHKKLPDMIAHASGIGLKTLIHTNGMLMNETISTQLVQAGLSEVSFSFEGETPKKYESLRRNSDYKQVKENIQNFLKYIKKTKVVIEVLKFRNKDALAISEAFKNEFPGAYFKSFFASNWHGTINMPELNETLIYAEKSSMCKAAQEVFAISWDGLVHPCCLDYNNELIIGDMKTQSIRDVWYGEQRRQVLNKMEKGLYKDLSICKQCGAPFTIETKERNIE